MMTPVKPRFQWTTWLQWGIPLILSAIFTFSTRAMAIGEYKSKVDMSMAKIEQVEREDKSARDVIWKNLSTYRDMTIQHEALIPRVERRMDEIDNKIDKIYDVVTRMSK